MHNNFIHSGRCHKSVLNRVNNFVQHLPGQFLNCEESCCDMLACRCSGTSSPTPQLPLYPFQNFANSLTIACSHTRIDPFCCCCCLVCVYLGAARLIPSSFIGPVGPGATAWPIHTCSSSSSNSINCACWNVSAVLLEQLHDVIDAINYNLSSIKSPKSERDTSCIAAIFRDLQNMP